MGAEKTIVSLEEGVELAANAGTGAARRASMFMAHGINTSLNCPEASFHLPGFIQLVDVPEEIPDDHKERFGVDFREWIVANGFRELLEGVEQSLNFFFRVLLEAKQGKSSKKVKPGSSAYAKFEKLGVGPKFKYLEKHFGFETSFGNYYESLTKVRNCLAHRRGYVAERDLDNGSDALSLIWLGVDAEFEEFDGTKHAINIDTVGPIDSSKFHQGGDAKLHIAYVVRTELFELGDRIQINPRHLQEICSMTSYVSLKLRQLTINYLLELGLNVNWGMRAEDPQASLLMRHD